MTVMQTRNPILDDLARVASGAAGVVAGMRREIEAQVRHRLERKLGELDLVPREDFDAVKEMAATARAAQEDLADRVAALEARLAAAVAPKAKPRPRKAPVKKPETPPDD